MTEETPSGSRPDFLTVPMSIIIAGALIAAAILFSGSAGFSISRPKATLQPTSAAVMSPLPTVAANQGVGTIRPISNQDHIRGAANAKVTVIEYSDLECPFCKQFHPTLARLLQEYPNDVRWVYRHLPLPQLHSKAPKEAEAVECAGEQSKDKDLAWAMIDKIFEVTPSNNGLDPADLPKLAQQVGVTNLAQFKSCLDSGKYAKYVQDDVADATSAGGQGTPYTVAIGPQGQKVPISGALPYASVKATVESLLK